MRTPQKYFRDVYCRKGNHVYPVEADCTAYNIRPCRNCGGKIGPGGVYEVPEYIHFLWWSFKVRGDD